MDNGWSSLVRPPRRERASAVVMTVLVFAIALVALATVVVTARATLSRAEAQSAADAVALAIAATDVAAGEAVAATNGAMIVSLTDDFSGVVVTVARGGVRASARAIRVECPGSCAAIP